jgi:hypothetical protein
MYMPNHPTPRHAGNHAGHVPGVRKTMTKTECAAALSIALTSASRWRETLAEKYTGDRRYLRAARNLAKLAGEAASLTDAQFAALDFESERWHEALRQAAREVGFKFNKASLRFFVRCLVRELDEPATA